MNYVWLSVNVKKYIFRFLHALPCTNPQFKNTATITISLKIPAFGKHFKCKKRNKKLCFLMMIKEKYIIRRHNLYQRVGCLYRPLRSLLQRNIWSLLWKKLANPKMWPSLSVCLDTLFA